ncbi:MAG: hypothetical protein JNN15_04085 [Blastocatellia bacterium]|nr:hypothetical protein [Blastocatellia bacterium]
MIKYFRYLFVCLLFLLPTLVANAQSERLSTVTFEFDGMMAVFAGDPQRVSVGILDVHHHTPQLVVYKLIAGERREVARFEGEQLNQVLNVSVLSENPVKAARLKPTRYTGLDGSSDQDFRWTLDIERELYQRPLRTKDNFFGKIHFQTGTFYSSRMSEDLVRFVSVEGNSWLPFLRQIARPATKIDLAAGQELFIEGLGQKLKAESDVNYLVSVTNLPPEDMMSMDHFEYYYSIIDEDVTRYTPVEIKKSFFGIGVFCVPVVFGQSPIK